MTAARQPAPLSDAELAAAENMMAVPAKPYGQMETFTHRLLATIAADRARLAELQSAAAAFDADLSDACDGPPRDRLRAALVLTRTPPEGPREEGG